MRANLSAVHPVRSTFHVENQEQLNYWNLKRYAFFFVRRVPRFFRNLFLSRRHEFHQREKKTRRKIILLAKRGKERRFVTHKKNGNIKMSLNENAKKWVEFRGADKPYLDKRMRCTRRRRGESIARPRTPCICVYLHNGNFISI